MNGKLRIAAALLFGALLVGGSYYLSAERAPQGPDSRVEAVVAPAPPRDYIEVEDANGNGISDWRESLPEIPNLADKLAAASSTATTSTHTGELAVYMLQSMLQSNMSGVYQTSPEALTLDSAAYLRGLATDELFTEADIVTSSDTSTAALRAYGNRVAELTEENAADRTVETELTILGRALSAGDPALLADLALIVESYEGVIADMQTLPAPESYAKEHLDLLNTYNAILIDVRGMEAAFADPLYALARIGRYEEDGRGLLQAFANLYRELHEDGIIWTDTDAAAEFAPLADIEQR